MQAVLKKTEQIVALYSLHTSMEEILAQLLLGEAWFECVLISFLDAYGEII